MNQTIVRRYRFAAFGTFVGAALFASGYGVGGYVERHYAAFLDAGYVNGERIDARVVSMRDCETLKHAFDELLLPSREASCREQTY